MKTFKSAYLKLTLFYVLIVMFISVIFSIVLYQISTNELSRGLDRQTKFLRLPPPDQNNTSGTPQFFVQNLEKLRIDQLDESNQHLKINLIYFNLLILVLSTLVSYFLAKRTLRPIEKMMDSQNRFTADASHELRTPLTAMRTEIEVNMRDMNLDLENAKKLLKSNLEEISKLESLSHALLTLAKFQDEGKKSLSKINLEEIITQSYEKIESLAEKKNIEFENKFEEIYVKGDKLSITELFVILIDNAIKYSLKGSKIKINISKKDKNAKISITDQGVGIKASDLPFIFNRFYRADNSRNKEKADGYGLGLSIAKRIVEINKGTIKVESDLGKGSTFIVTLPLN